MDAARFIRLNTGAKMPAVGLGTWQSKPEEVKLAVKTALECGYRHIDTAFAYQNEAAIGEVLREFLEEGQIRRQDLFITTKLHIQYLSRGDVKECLSKSLEDLGLDYVDLYLVHGPIGLQKDPDSLFPVKDGKVLVADADHLETWRGMEDVYKGGMARAIGLSNFNARQIRRIYDNADVKPSNLQVECHAYFPQEKLRDYITGLNMTMTAYAPLGSPSRSASMFSLKQFPVLLDDKMVKMIGERHGKSPAQVLLRWNIQRGIAVIPKSVTPERIRTNFEIFDFHLSEEEMSVLSNLGINQRTFTADIGIGHPEFPFNDPF